MRVLFCVHHADDAVRRLLHDVLGDSGLRLTDATGADLVFTCYDAITPLSQLVAEAIADTGAQGVVVVLPFEDLNAAALALSVGALSTFTLGTSIARLEQAVRIALTVLHSEKVAR